MESASNADPAKAGKIAQQIVNLLLHEDEGMRTRALQAAALLLGQSTPALSDREKLPAQSHGEPIPETDIAAFFEREADMKPADHVLLCAAYYFALHGATAFSVEQLREIAGEAGVILPNRIDMTLNVATKKGRKLFQSAGKGSYKPTAAAGLLFKERWNVKPGKA